MRMLGIVLIILGALSLVYQGFTYVTREKVVDAGPVQITADKNNYVFVPPLVGAVVLAAGVATLTMGKK